MEDYECTRCSFKISNLRLFVKHVRRHERNNPYFTFTCKACNIVFSSSRLWHVHETKHHSHSEHHEPSEVIRIPPPLGDPQVFEDGCVGATPGCQETEELLIPPKTVPTHASCRYAQS